MSEVTRLHHYNKRAICTLSAKLCYGRCQIIKTCSYFTFNLSSDYSTNIWKVFLFGATDGINNKRDLGPWIAPLNPYQEERMFTTKYKLYFPTPKSMRNGRLTFLKSLILVFHFTLVIHIFDPLKLNLLFVILNEVCRIFI